MSVLVAAMHRSGSTHIARSISMASGAAYSTGMINLQTTGDDPHVLPIDKLHWHNMRLNGIPFVYHQHVMATQGTVEVLKLMELTKIVVVVRKVSDVLTSVCHAHRTGGQMPDVHLPLHWREWDEGDQMIWLVRNFSPWLFAFYTTWKERVPHSLMVSYGEHYNDEKAGNARIFKYLDIGGAPCVFRFEKGADGIIAGEKPEWRDWMTVELHKVASTWSTYNAMKEDGVV